MSRSMVARDRCDVIDDVNVVVDGLVGRRSGGR